MTTTTYFVLLLLNWKTSLAAAELVRFLIIKFLTMVTALTRQITQYKLENYACCARWNSLDSCGFWDL